MRPTNRSLQIDRFRAELREAVQRRGPDQALVVRRVTRGQARLAEELAKAYADGRIDGARRSKLTVPTTGTATSAYFMLDESALDGDDVLE